MDSGNDEESELDTKRNKTAGNGGEKAKLGSSVGKSFTVSLDGLLHHRALYHKASLRAHGERSHMGRKTDMGQADRSMCA